MTYHAMSQKSIGMQHAIQGICSTFAKIVLADKSDIMLTNIFNTIFQSASSLYS